MTVTLLEVLAAGRARQASVVAETAGSVVLALADQLAVAPRQVAASRISLQPEGGLRLDGGRAVGEAVSEASLRMLLGSMLDLGRTAPPALSRVSQRPARGSLGGLVRELEAALIPVNRAAGRRALARLHRETTRALAAGLPPAAVRWAGAVAASLVEPAAEQNGGGTASRGLGRRDAEAPESRASHPSPDRPPPAPGEVESPVPRGASSYGGVAEPALDDVTERVPMVLGDDETGSRDGLPPARTSAVTPAGAGGGAARSSSTDALGGAPVTAADDQTARLPLGARRTGRPSAMTPVMAATEARTPLGSPSGAGAAAIRSDLLDTLDKGWVPDAVSGGRPGQGGRRDAEPAASPQVELQRPIPERHSANAAAGRSARGVGRPGESLAGPSPWTSTEEPTCSWIAPAVAAPLPAVVAVAREIDVPPVSPSPSEAEPSPSAPPSRSPWRVRPAAGVFAPRSSDVDDLVARFTVAGAGEAAMVANLAALVDGEVSARPAAVRPLPEPSSRLEAASWSRGGTAMLPGTPRGGAAPAERLGGRPLVALSARRG